MKKLIILFTEAILLLLPLGSFSQVQGKTPYVTREYLLKNHPKGDFYVPIGKPLVKDKYERVEIYEWISDSSALVLCNATLNVYTVKKK